MISFCALLKMKLNRLVSCRYVVFLTFFCLWPTIRTRRAEELEGSSAQVPTRLILAKVGTGQVKGGGDEPEVSSWRQGGEKISTPRRAAVRERGASRYHRGQQKLTKHYSLVN